MKTQHVLICNQHQEYPVAIIQTFAFANAIFWCPFCGQSSSFQENKTTVHVPLPSILDRAAYYEKNTKNFLYACAAQRAAFIEHEGKPTEFKDLPLEKQRKIKEWAAQGWPLYQKAEVQL